MASLQLPGLMADGFLWRRRQTSLLIRTKNLRGTDFLRRFTKNKPAFRVLAMIFLGSRCAHVELQSRMLLTIRNVIRANIQTLKRRSGYLYIMNWFAFKTSISQLELSVWNAWKKVVGRSVSKENGMNFGLNLPTFRQNRSLKVPQNVKTATLPESLSSLIFERGVSELQPNVSRCFGSEFWVIYVLGKKPDCGL